MNALSDKLAARVWRLPALGIETRTLTGLILAAAIPVLLFGGWVALLTARQQRALDDRAAVDTLSRITERVSANVAQQVASLSALATSTSLDGSDLSPFYTEAARLRADHPSWETIELADPSGVQVVNLLRSLGSALGPTADRDSFDQVVATHRPAIGGLGPVGSVSGRRLVALRVPVLRDGTLRYVISVALAVDAISAVLRGSGVPGDWIGVIVDRHGTIIARTRSDEQDAGRPGSPSLRAAIERAPDGSYDGDTLEGAQVQTVYRTLAGTDGWSAHCGVPAAILSGPTTRSRHLLAAGALASVALGGLLAAMTAQDVTRRRRDEKRRMNSALRTSEEEGAVAVEAAELGTVRFDVSRFAVMGSERARALLSLPPAEPGSDAAGWTMRAVLAGIHPEDRADVEAALQRCAAEATAIDTEFRVSAGEAWRWVSLKGQASHLCGSTGDRLVFCVVADAEPRRRAEAERVDLYRRLAQGQEDEQRRIARELHDQVGQTVTALALGLKQVEGDSSGPGQTSRERIGDLRRLVDEIGRQIHRAAYDLRPIALDDLGLEEALRALVETWGRRHDIAVDLQSYGGGARLPVQTETALFRVAQEALTNVLKHARARRVDLVLERRPGEVRMIVEDDGVGLPVEGGLEPARRLGLRGMRERLALLDGSLAVESPPGGGTTLIARVPVASSSFAEEV